MWVLQISQDCPNKIVYTELLETDMHISLVRELTVWNQGSFRHILKCTHEASVSWIVIYICNQALLSCDIKMSQQDTCQSEVARRVFTINIFYAHSHTEQEAQPICVQSDIFIEDRSFSDKIFWLQFLLPQVPSDPPPPLHISKSIHFLYCSHQNINRHPIIMMMLIK